MDTRIVAIVVDSSTATGFALMLARLFDTVVSVRRSRNVTQLMGDLRELKADNVLCADELSDRVIRQWMQDLNNRISAPRFIVLSYRGLNREQMEAIESALLDQAMNAFTKSAASAA